MWNALLEVIGASIIVISLYMVVMLVLVQKLPETKFRVVLAAPIKVWLKIRSWARKPEYEYNDDYSYFCALTFDSVMSEEMANAVAIRVFNAKGLVKEEYSFFFQLYIGFLQGNLSPEDAKRLEAWARMVQAEEILFLAPTTTQSASKKVD